MKNLKFLPLAIVSFLMFASCEKDAEEVNEEEVITTVTTTLTAGTSVIILKAKDSDGDGANKPVITVSGDLVANTTYKGATTFSNELKSPAEDITVEVQAEGEEHQLFYQAVSSIGTFTYTDKDKNGKSIGLSFDLKTGAAATTGDLTVTLRHKPNKSASGVAEGNIANAGGATDASVVFPIKVVLGKL
jgi:beta-lactamase superfamily II metal-dependent hydrolase